MRNIKPFALLLTFVFLFYTQLFSQPSGGPYGPVQQFYELPEVSGTLYYVAPNGNPDARGSSAEMPTTIESAVARVVSGDAIIMRGGTYRTGNLTFNQAITIQPYRDEYPVLKGTKVAENWTKTDGDVWVTNWEHLFPGQPEDWWRREREEKFTPLHRFNNDGIFIDGKYLQSVGSITEIAQGTYYVDYDAQKIYIGNDPTDRMVEITAFRKAIFRPNAEVHGKKPDARGPIIRGIEITQYPDTMVHIGGDILAIDQHGRDIVGTLFENCTFSNCFRIGVFVIGDSLVMRNCLVTDTNTEGVYVVASEGIVLERNIFARNNIERWTGFYPASVKIFNQCKRAVVSDNLVIDHPHSNGIWYDVGNTDGIFVNNWLQNIGTGSSTFRASTIWNGQNAFFFEISKGVTCAGNLFVNCDIGVLILNSSDAKIYQNTFVNSQTVIARDQRSWQGDHFGWHPRTGPDVNERIGHEFVNNLMYGDETYDRPLLHIWQPNFMCEQLQEPALLKLDHNVYVTYTNREPLITLSQDLNDECQHFFGTPAGLNGLVGAYEKSGTSWKEYRGLLFKGLKTGNYQIDGRFKGIQSATTSPAYIRELLDSHGLPPYPGAYKP